MRMQKMKKVAKEVIDFAYLWTIYRGGTILKIREIREIRGKRILLRRSQ